MKRTLWCGAAVLALLQAPTLAVAATGCADLTSGGAQPAGVEITEAVETPATADIPVDHCLVRGKTPDRVGADGKTYAIRFELRLPQAWNGRFVHQFNGGNDGAVVPALGPVLGGNKADTALARGYAVVSSDAGHDGKANPDKGLAGGAAFGFDPQARRDYGYGAVATLNPLAEALVERYYGQKIAFSYGIGSSNGGRHGMVAASRTPQMFDGILSGYPGFNLPKAALQHALDVQAWSKVNPEIAKAFSRDDMQVLAKGILNACDALDGAKDGIVADADACEAAFKPETLACAKEGDKDCLSPAQIEALVTSHKGPRNAKDEQLYSTWVWDPGMASNNWRGWKLESPVEAWGKRPIIGVMGAASLAQVFTTPPTPVGGSPEELQTFLLNFDIAGQASKVLAKDATFTESAADVMIPPGADNPDLKAFRDAGHKMIVFHGNADPVFSVVDTVNWYRKLDQNNGGKAGDFVKLYRVPGMPHGAGGPSYDDFDFFSPLVAWVEEGKVPGAVAAGVTPANKEAEHLKGTRFLYCPYPQVTRATGAAGTGEDRLACQ
ncbi:tannase/feruloyl esterase family alpha/beta hydrolase [Affinirhizobium pseudoryzae]|uniref:tannase/feruloyl esterase family alpha/beta hydrolase n=1 Tax=Allorhizobium pseudoryzae TaxID=379684 RepID=UPI0013EB00B7|nr:tannase/feruloyl esterase family alpha/beta hydrolase [Allorhizobium pseudoryzae]